MPTSGLRLHWPALAFVLLILAALTLGWLVPDNSRWSSLFQFLSALIPSALALAQYLYARVDCWRLMVNRWRLRASNAETSWSVRAEYAVADARAACASVEHRLGVASGASLETRRLSGDGLAHVWLWRGLTVRLVVASAPDLINEESAATLVVDFPSVRRAYRSLERCIRDELGPLLAEIERSIEHDSAKYEVRLTFKPVNPYFGLFVSNVSRDRVTRFDIDMIEIEPVTGERDMVRVSKSSLGLVTATAHSAERLSLRYLALRSMSGDDSASIV